MFSSKIKELGIKAKNIASTLETEEATKTALVLPLLNILGFDVFNPNEVIPEFVADLGTKKGEKVDYAIKVDGKLEMIIECKKSTEKLDSHHSQLHRYYSVSDARFAVLTNGIEYEFYADLKAKNVMDSQPFFRLNILQLNEQKIKQIAKFQRDDFDASSIFANANDLKYITSIKNYFDQQTEEVDADLAKYLARKFYSGKVISQKVVEKFKGITQSAFTQWSNETTNLRLKEKEQAKKMSVVDTPASKINTTEEEIEGYHIVKAICRKVAEGSRIFYRDAQSYFTVIFDDNNRKPICRLWLEGNKKFIGLFDEEKNCEKKELKSLEDIYKYQKALRDRVNSYL